MPSATNDNTTNSGQVGENSHRQSTVVPYTNTTQSPSAIHDLNTVAYSLPASSTFHPVVSTATVTPSAAAPLPALRAAAPLQPVSDPLTAAEKKKQRKVEKMREERRRKEESEFAKREAAPPQRRTIPVAPHRQLFLVDGYYCGADPSQPPASEVPLLRNRQAEEIHGGRDPVGGAGGVLRPGVDSAALSNRIGTAPGRQLFGQPGASNRVCNDNNTTSANGLSFYISPSVPASFQIGKSNNNNNNNNNSRGVNPSQSSPLPQASDSSTGKSHTSHKLKKLRIKQRFFEPVELQVESLSALIMRLTLFLWYASLITALVIEVIPRVQWSMVNICGTSHKTDLRRTERWSSPCVTSAPMTKGSKSSNVMLTWRGNHLSHLHSKLVRYRRVVVSLPTPADQVDSVAEYELIAFTTMEEGGLTWMANRSVTLRCQKKNSRCDMARVPEDLLRETGGAASYNFSLMSVPPSLATGAANGAVGVVYQRSAYTIATVVWRYVLLFFSFVHALRFIAFRKYTSTLYEQGWTLALQIALMWYLDPLFALNIMSWPIPAVLAFLEYRIPTYFMAVMIAYMLSVMTASMAWPMHAKANGPQSLSARIGAFLLRSRNVYDPPMWTKIVISVYTLCIFVIDIIDACVDQYDWFAASNSNVHFKRIYWAVIALLLFGGLVCLIMLMYLRNYLGAKPYLESRPQQLACRVFLMFFLSAVVYYIIHCLVFFLLYNRNYTACTSQQPFLQLPTLMVASFFVNIMTLVYTSQNRNDSVPINPKDFRWKHMVWPDTWYRWLARHGGSQYIFLTEAEETRFYRLQFEFRKRQFMAKQKRKHQQEWGGGGGGVSNLETYEQSTSLRTQWEAAHSGFLSMFRMQNTMSGTTTRRGSRGATVAGAPGQQWRTDVWETPLPSHPASPLISEPEGDDGGSGSRGAGPRRQLQQGFPNSLTDACTLLNDTADGCRRGGGDAGNHSCRVDNHNTVAAADPAVAGATNRNMNFLSNSRNAGVARVRDGVGLDSNDMTSVNVAARSILNMDRFCTYFLADNNNSVTATGVGTAPPVGSYAGLCTRRGGFVRRQNSTLSSAVQSPQRKSSSAFDAYEVEGPARRRSRLLQQQQLQNNLPRRRCESSLLLREYPTALTECELARNHTFAGLEEAHPLRSHSVQAELHVTTPLRRTSCQRGGGDCGSARHVRSCSDGDVLNGTSSEQVGTDLDKSPLQTSHPSPPQQHQQQQRHIDIIQEPTQVATAAPAPPPLDTVPVVAAHPNDETDPCFNASVAMSVDSTSGTVHALQSETLLQAIRQVQQESFTSPPDNLRKGPRALPTFAPTPTSAQPSTANFDSRATNSKTATNNNVASAAAVAAGEDPRHRRVSPQPRRTHAFHSTFAQSTSTAEGDMASDLSPPTSDTDSGSNSGSEHGHGRQSFFHTLSMVRERLGAVMGAAERNLFERPVRNLDRFEMQVFDAVYRPFQTMHYLPFFNLETAIDCYNISWEAYGVEKSVGDDLIETGIKMTPQNVPKTVAHGVKKLMCGCCPAGDDSSQYEEDSDVEADNENEAQNGGDAENAGDENDNNGNGSVRFPRASMTGKGNARSKNEGNENTSAAVPPALSSQRVEMTKQEKESEEMLERHESVTVENPNSSDNGAPTALHQHTAQNSDDTVVIVHMSGEGAQNNVPRADCAPAGGQGSHRLTDKDGNNNNNNSKDSDRENSAAKEGEGQASAAAANGERLSRGIAQGGPTTTHEALPPASTPAVATDPNVFPINVEKYGFTLLLVAEAKEVQVIIVKMDTSAPEHRGKAPRIIIGFRGTANMSNAKYDMNIHRVVWREMERVEAENDEKGLNGMSLDVASTMDGASSMGTRHLGCAACVRSCLRVTSWRPTCHAGFLSIWKTLKPTVMRRVCEILREDRNIVHRVFTTGHSLGGALASLCAYSLTAMLRRMDYPIPEVTVYTYGQPRLGNRTFQRIYNKAVPRSFRVVNESDMVVTMTMFGGYHVGIEVDVDRHGNFIVKPTEMEKLFPPTKGRGLTVINHLMTNYGISLNAIATRTTCPARGLECYLTADPKKIEREKATEEALKRMPENKKLPEAS